MLVMLLGLLLFLGAHSVRIFAEDWRHRQIERLGMKRWKIFYSIVAATGLVLTIYGYGLTREAPIAVWLPPMWTQHLVALLMIPAFLFLVATYTSSHIRSVIRHPMILGVMLWALGHLLVNGSLGDIVLFGAFLGWAIMDFYTARLRDRQGETVSASARFSGDVIAVLVGLSLYFAFAFYLHSWVIGVPALG